MKRKPKSVKSRAKPSASKRKKAEELLAAFLPASSPSKNLVFYCDLCGSLMYEAHCKIICPNCGYTRDCSDP